MATTVFSQPSDAVSRVMFKSFLDAWRAEYLRSSVLPEEVARDIFDECVPVVMTHHAAMGKIADG